MRSLTQHLTNQRGMALAFTAMAMTAFIGLAVVGIDLGRLAFTATEVQTVADIAATAGARSLYNNTFNGDSRNVVGDAQTTVASAGNKMDGAAASIAAGDVEVGIYNFQNQTFTATANNPNAVRATGRKTVNNFIAAAIGSTQTEVVKQATAPFSGPATGCNPPAGCAATDWPCFCQNGVPPCLAIAAPDCRFTANGQLPPLRVSSSNDDTAAWTGFQSGHSANDVRGYLEQGPCDAPGNPSIPGIQGVGAAQIDVTNGLNPSCSSAGNAFGLMQCLYENNQGCRDTNNDGVVDASGGTIFSIPIFHLDSCTTNPTGMQPIVGFATVNVTGVQCDSDGKRVDMQVISRNSNTPQPLGAACFGTSCQVVLVQ